MQRLGKPRPKERSGRFSGKYAAERNVSPTKRLISCPVPWADCQTQLLIGTGMSEDSRPRTALILSGGLALGAYQLGAIERLERARRFDFTAIAGASIGAINGAIIAGNPPERRLERLHAFWEELAEDRKVIEWVDPLGLLRSGSPRHAHNWLSVATARLTGARSLFRPRGPLRRGTGGVPSLYDADRTRATLVRFVDFERLNEGGIRFCCAATDIATGESVVFDTARGDHITADHLLASGSLLPAFDPVEIDGRLLGDGGFSANAPLEPLLASDRIGDPVDVCFLIDLFAPDGPVPQSLERVAERASDLKFACQTRMRLDAIMREREIEAVSSDVDAPGTDLYYLSYRSLREEAGPEKAYDFSARSIADRRAEGAADAEAALVAQAAASGSAAGLRTRRIRRTA